MPREGGDAPGGRVLGEGAGAAAAERTGESALGGPAAAAEEPHAPPTMPLPPMPPPPRRPKVCLGTVTSGVTSGAGSRLAGGAEGALSIGTALQSPLLVEPTSSEVRGVACCTPPLEDDGKLVAAEAAGAGGAILVVVVAVVVAGAGLLLAEEERPNGPAAAAADRPSP